MWRIIFFLPFLQGCAMAKKSIATGAITSGVGLVTDLITPSFIAPAIASGVTATALTAYDDITDGDKIMDCAPDNIWSMIGTLIETGGLWIGLIVLVCVVFGLAIPSPLQFKTKRNAK